MRYALGVLAGIISGLVFTGAMIAQKRAIDAIGSEKPLFRNLIKSPLWAAGFAASFILGAPLNMLAYMAVGPTIPPALCSLGLAAVPLFARLFLGERPGPRAWAGAAAVAAGVALIGLSGVAIAPEKIDWLEPGFAVRAAIAVASTLLAAGACLALGSWRRAAPLAATAFAIAAGLSQALANALMAPIAGQLGSFVSGGFGLGGLAIIGGASLALAGVNFGAIAVAQLALRKGRATVVIPLQQLPIQLLPLVLHAAVYRGGFGSGAGLLVTGLALLIAGAFVLGPAAAGRRSAKPAAAIALAAVLAASFAPASLEAQGRPREPGAIVPPGGAAAWRYATLGADGAKTGELELRARAADGSLGLEYRDRAGRLGYARLGPGLAQEALGLDAGPAGPAQSFALDRASRRWSMSGAEGRAMPWREDSFLSDPSLFFIIPSLIDPREAGAEARFTIVMPRGGRRSAMRLRTLGPVLAADASGAPRPAFAVEMELAEPIARLFWPYVCRYFFSREDLSLLRYEGPDEGGRPSALALIEVAR